MLAEHDERIGVPRSAPTDAGEPAPGTHPQSPPGGGRWAEQLLTALIVFAPLAALVLAVTGVLGHGPSRRDALLTVFFFYLTGHGVTIGFHRHLAHKSFKAKRHLRNALVVAGSMAYEGPVIGWVADHRRHHAFTDRPGDPHSPHRYGSGFTAQLRGLWHAHMGWLFQHDPTSQAQYARDLLADPHLVRINRLFPLWCVLSLALPFGAGWVLGGDLGAAASALLWAGGVRICLLHHVTWSVNSLCHVFGRRPYATRDRSTNLALLAVPSMGEAWHNNHHAFPTSARHGIDRGQVDTSAAIIGVFIRLGWVTEARTPRRFGSTGGAHRPRRRGG